MPSTREHKLKNYLSNTTFRATVDNLKFSMSPSAFIAHKSRTLLSFACSKYFKAETKKCIDNNQMTIRGLESLLTSIYIASFSREPGPTRPAVVMKVKPAYTIEIVFGNAFMFK